MKIRLISMPWPLFNRPSIQLGTLKAYLESRADWLTVDTAHPYLELAAEIGTVIYHWISQNTWVSESLYVPVLYPDKTDDAKSLSAKYLTKADKNIIKSFDFIQTHRKVRQQLENWVESCDWSQYRLIGFSVCFHQLLASLAAAAMIKKKYPQIKIAFGGSSCGSDVGRSLLKTFDSVDHVITGEGETAMLELCRYVNGVQDTMPQTILPEDSQPLRRTAGQISSLHELPAPDYDDYFSDLKQWFRDMPFIPVLPVEFSRGCWWNRCSFCNLNLQWDGYRCKKAEQVLNETALLSRKYGSLDFAFTDNMLPPDESRRFFSTLAAEPSDFSFFAEIRSPGKSKPVDKDFSTFRSGGLTTIQVGIESLSNSLLKKMRKGTSVIENIAMLRAAQESSIRLEGNLITRFPRSTSSEVNETLENLDYVFPFAPLSAAAFFLGHGSPVCSSPEDFGISAIVNHANNRKLFPEVILRKLNHIIMDYRSDKTAQRKLWRPVERKVEAWRRYHENRSAGSLEKPLLSYRNGSDFLIIRQELPDGRVLHRRLSGASRNIYLSCTKPTAEKALFDEYRHISRKKILAFLADLRQKRLLFTDKDKHLALAVHLAG